MSINKLISAIIVCLSVSACDTRNHDWEQDNATVNHEVRTPMQKQYSTLEECKKDFSQPGDCKQQAIVGTNNGTTSLSPFLYYYLSPYYYPWGAVYHSNGIYSYNNRVPSGGTALTNSTSSTHPDFSRATSYTNSRISSLTSSRGGFGATARAASSASSGG